jgi:integrase
MNYPITPQTTVDTLVDLWLRQLRTEERLEGSTIDEYERVLRKLVVPRIGGARLSELTMNLINVVLAELGTESLNFQRKAKVVTGAMLDTAVELGALTVNPVRGSLSISRRVPEHRSLTASELKNVRVAVRAWLSKERSGPKSSGDIADIIELMVATGARIGEVLALRWADLDLSTRVVEINATTKTESGLGTYRKPLARPRLVALPGSAAMLLDSRHRSVPDNFLDAVFPTRNVTWQQVNNLERRWRQIRREAGLEWVTTEAFRRSSPDGVPSRDCLPEP